MPLNETTDYWRRNRRLTLLLLLLWTGITFGVSFFARELSFSFFGWPFSFWVASQGALIVYCLIIWYYAWAMDRLDREHGAQDEPPARDES
ncbi:MAG TPA: DUF4212 domain-containing protein [Roseateles sp.]|nr:DUF4212 domain-containing protein [Roseateles sp.]